MLLRLLIMAPLIFASPILQVQWVGERRNAVRIQAEDKDQTLGESCLKSGFELRYRFSVHVCKKRPLWLDRCPQHLDERHGLRYDAITDTYAFTSDRLRDEPPPTSEAISSPEAAFKALSSLGPIPLRELTGGDEAMLTSQRRYLSVRVISECKGDHSETLARISDVLTLGLVQVSGFDTGWVDFAIIPEAPAK